MARLWLETQIPDSATRKWVVQNSPDVARLLAENVDEADAAVRELRARTEHPGSRPFDYFLSLSKERREWLAVAYPSLIGNLDGAPPEMRWTANRTSLVAYREKLFDDLAVSQAQGYRAPARDESSLSLRINAIDMLLASDGGSRVLAFDKPDTITPMRVALAGSAAGVSAIELARLMNDLAEAAGKQLGYSDALLRDFDTLSRSDDPAVARFGREMGADLRTSGRIDPGRAAELLGKVEWPLAIVGVLADANQRIQEGDKPPDAVLGAVGKGAAGFGGAAGAGAICLATGAAALPCALIAVGGAAAGELLWDVSEDGRDYAFTAAPGDVDSSTLSMYADARPYDPEKYFIPLPTKPQDIGPGQRAGIPRETRPEGHGPYVGHPGQRGGVPTDRPAGWPYGTGD
ncbi:MAG: hypothetical protein GEV11_27085 [Streptosporangiales bacterium]|nr:hypothetical protein [Streptosporangiales bacterium]